MIAQNRIPLALASAGVSVAAAWIAAPQATAVDARLPLIAGVVALLAILARGAAARVADVLPLLLVVAAVAIEGETLRLCAYGAIVAAAFAIAAISRCDEEGIGLSDAVLLLATMLVLIAALPEPDHGIRYLLLFAGGVAMLFAGSVERRISVEWMILSGVVMASTPVIPGRASLFPLLLTIVLRAIRKPSIPAAIAGFILSVVIGWWAIPLGAGALVAAGVTSRSSNRAATLPAVAGGAAAVMIPLAVFPAAIGRIRSAGGPALSAAAVFILAAFAFRPAVGLLYGLAAVAAIIVTPQSGASRGAVVSSALALALLCLVAWSGAIYPFLTFPRNGAIVIAAVLILAGAAGLLRSSAAISIVGSVVVLGALAFLPAQRATERIERSLAAGEETFVKPGRSVERLGIEFSGARTTTLPPGASLGTLTVVDDAGRAFERSLTSAMAADWAAFRRDDRFASRNPIASDPAPRLVGYGHDAFLTGAGRISVEARSPIALLRFEAAEPLPPGARLQIDAIVYEGPR
ncbi:MAG: hypothetical protein ACYC7A_21380 [Thermoanaerobaculia bacterium]